MVLFFVAVLLAVSAAALPKRVAQKVDLRIGQRPHGCDRSGRAGWSWCM